jgi:hypothetical protein
MPEFYSQCPKCGHRPAQPLPKDAACPACGIYFFKWAQPARPPVLSKPIDGEQSDSGDESAGFPASLFLPMPRMDPVSFYGRSIVLVLLTIWSFFLIRYDYRTGAFFMSFMHNILLPIHEAGHVLFRPFTEFMMVLGGSLFQLLLPFSIGVAFIVKNRDNFGAAICFWWTSVSLVDLSPYIYDALHPQLTLVGGGNGADDGPHDWIYLLIRMGQIDNAQRWGAFVHTCGALLMLVALAWCITLLLRQRALIDSSAGEL